MLVSHTRLGLTLKHTNPILLEAILRTEVAILNAYLKTCRTLQGRGIIFAVCSEALLLGWRFGGHDGGGSVKAGNRNECSLCARIRVE